MSTQRHGHNLIVRLYRSLLGTDFEELSAPLQTFHDGGTQAEGTLTVARSTSFFAFIVATFMALPRTGEGLPTTVDIQIVGEEEVWRRQIGRSKLTSIQFARDGVLIERFGSLRFFFEVLVVDGGMVFESKQTQLFGQLLPSFLSPKIVAQTKPTEAGWHVFVGIQFGTLGTICQYDGEMRMQ